MAEYMRPALAQTRRCGETVLTPGRRRIPVVVNARIHPRDGNFVRRTVFRAEIGHELHDALLRPHRLLKERANRLRYVCRAGALWQRRIQFLPRRVVARGGQRLCAENARGGV